MQLAEIEVVRAVRNREPHDPALVLEFRVDGRRVGLAKLSESRQSRERYGIADFDGAIEMDLFLCDKTLREIAGSGGTFPEPLRRMILQSAHPLVNTVNTLFDVPHSRFNDISRGQLEEAGLHILAESERAGVHLAVSTDGFRQVFFQGHPEYDTISLLKEYKREVGRFASGERDDYPPFPGSLFLPSIPRHPGRACARGPHRPAVAAPIPPIPGGAHRRPPRQYLARYG